ncbi:MAG: hypothetical protein CFE21_10330 [Bacteroidetes bacterium B1(2017)]|nr:MAG: hypothetical protein CFE21_10330 [Bacteroidetes bacterium B1(2017)]
MKKKNSLAMGLLLILSFSFSNPVYSQTKNKIYFSEFGGTVLMDYFSSKLVPLTGDYDFGYDANYNPIKSPGSGYIKFSSFNFISLNYTARVNIYEINKDRSFSIDVPITAGFGVGFKNALVISRDSLSSSTNYNYKEIKSAEGTSIFNLSVPVFISFNMGMGSTYDNDSDKGLTVGVGFDCAHPLLFIEGKESFEKNFNSVKKSNFYFIPALSLGYRHWNGDKPLELNLKLGYTPSASNEALDYATTSVSKSGFSMRLSFNKILNF